MRQSHALSRTRKLIMAAPKTAAARRTSTNGPIARVCRARTSARSNRSGELSNNPNTAPSNPPM